MYISLSFPILMCFDLCMCINASKSCSRPYDVLISFHQKSSLLNRVQLCSTVIQWFTRMAKIEKDHSSTHNTKSTMLAALAATNGMIARTYTDSSAINNASSLNNSLK